METLNMAARFDQMCRTIVKVNSAGVPDCEDCNVEMEHIDTLGYHKPAPTVDSQPDFIETGRVYECPLCGRQRIIY